MLWLSGRVWLSGWVILCHLLLHRLLHLLRHLSILLRSLKIEQLNKENRIRNISLVHGPVSCWTGKMVASIHVTVGLLKTKHWNTDDLLFYLFCFFFSNIFISLKMKLKENIIVTENLGVISSFIQKFLFFRILFHWRWTGRIIILILLIWVMYNMVRILLT